MKRILLCLVSIIILLIPSKTYAHQVGQPPFFKINGTYSGLYDVGPRATVSEFVLPQDNSPATYLVNVPIVFEFDENQLPFAKELISKITLLWDFGDGQKGQGMKNTHRYTKMGSYILTVNAKFSDSTAGAATPLIQSVLVHVLPSKDYVLPKAVITVNGKEPQDALSKSYQMNIRQPMTFDATLSKRGSAEIASYFWDMGDNSRSTLTSVTHSYQDPYFGASPILRVRDENGFISDAAVTVNHTIATPTPAVKKEEKKNWLWAVGGVGCLVIIIGIIIKILKKNKKK
jgi:hypothetical protein